MSGHGGSATQNDASSPIVSPIADLSVGDDGGKTAKDGSPSVADVDAAVEEGGAVMEGEGADGVDGAKNKKAAKAVPAAPKPLTPDQRDKILTQVEFYFSDANLPTDAFLMKKVEANAEGWVPIGLVASFNRMKQLLKKHPCTVVAEILRDTSASLVVSDDNTQVRRRHPLPKFDLVDIQTRTVVAENFPRGGDGPSIDAVREMFAVAGEVLMVRVRHPGMQTPAVAAMPSGLDLVITPNTATHALVEFKSVEEAAKAVELLNNDRDWRNGLRVRMLVRPGTKKNKKKKQMQQGEAHEGEGEGVGSAAEEGAEGIKGVEEGAAGEGGAAVATAGKKKKGKYGRQKRDYSQWASAAAFKENKMFFEGGDGAVGGGDGAGGDSGGGDGEGQSMPVVKEQMDASAGAGAGAPPTAGSQPTMPDGTRGFHPGAGRGRRMPQPPPQ